MKTIIVVPHHLPTLDFLNEWKEEFNNNNTSVIVVEDKPSSILSHDSVNIKNLTIYSHKDINRDLGKDSWIIPRSTSAIRSYGLYKAWQQQPDMIITLDNDCFPDREAPYYVTGHWENLQTPTTLDWVYSTPSEFMQIPSRGFPYKIRGKATPYVSHGLWSNIPDLDAAQMLQMPDYRTLPARHTITIPRYNFAPICGMNLAFRPEATPLMYFGLFGPTYGFDQFDDIFMGVLVKKVLDHLGHAVVSGSPSVEHRKQSDAFTNFRKQAGGLELNEYFWQEVQKIQLTKDNVVDCYEELITKLPDTMPTELDGWTAKFKAAALIWVKLFRA